MSKNIRPLTNSTSKIMAAIFIFAGLMTYANSALSATDWQKKISFHHESKPILDVVKQLSKYIEKKFLVGKAKGHLTIINRKEISVKDAFSVFRAALIAQGYDVLEQEKFYKIQQARRSQRDNIEVFKDEMPTGDDRMVTLIYTLKHTTAQMANRSLRIIPSKEGEMAPFTPTNSLIISDHVGNLQRIFEVLREIDQPPAKSDNLATGF